MIPEGLVECPALSRHLVSDHYSHHSCLHSVVNYLTSLSEDFFPYL